MIPLVHDQETVLKVRDIAVAYVKGKIDGQMLAGALNGVYN